MRHKFQVIIRQFERLVFGRHPYNTIFNYNWLLIRKLIKDLNEIGKSDYIQGRMLDLGCGQVPYYSIFNKKISEYIGMDIAPDLDKKLSGEKFQYISGSIYNIPLPDNYVDVCFCSQVFSSLANPQQAIVEIVRVLKKDGRAIITAPHIMPLITEPHDYFRFTPSLFAEYAADYDIVIEELYWQGNLFDSVGLLFAMNLVLSDYKYDKENFKLSSLRRWCFAPITGFSNLIAFLLSQSLGKVMPLRCPTNFIVVMKKK
jgi:SAM-dependent methyltransferase